MRLNLPNRTTRVTTVACAALLSLTTIAVVALSAALFPSHLPVSRDPRLVDVIFDSPPVVWAARLLLMSMTVVLAVGGTYVVVSTVMRMRNGDWLRRAGPFEVSEADVAELEHEVHFWRSAARDYYDALERICKLDAETDEYEETATSDDDYDTL